MTKKKPLIAVIIVAFICILAGVFIMRFQQKAYKVQLFAMDTACSITIYSNDNNKINNYKNEITDLSDKLSAYNKNSEISKLNSGENIAISEQTKRLMNKSILLTEKYPQVDCTAGQLIDLWNVTGDNPHIPSDEQISKALDTIGSDNISLNGNNITLKNNAKINFGASAKGFALDEIKTKFDEDKIKCATVSFGSSILLYGEKPDGKKFKTAIANPDDPNETALTFETDECFISTSGGYERYFEADGKKYSHIFDLTTGYPAKTDLKSVTVISKSDGMLTDFLSTCIYIDGTLKIDKYLSDKSVMIIAIDEQNRIYCSENAKDKIEITDDDFSFVK